MKILFVNVVNPKNYVHIKYYPLSFGYLVSYARKHKREFDLLYRESVDTAILQAYNPDVVALTTITENYPRAKQFAKLINLFNKRIKIVIGGIHISCVPESLSPHMDVGIVGEGEQTFLELMQNDFIPEPNIDGLVYWEKANTLRVTNKRKLIEPLDNIPHPNRDIYGVQNRPSYLFTSRGCSYRCAFCSSSRFWEKVRFHSAEYVAEEVRELVHSGSKFIDIYDDCCPLNFKRLMQIKDLVKGLDVCFGMSVRANLVTEELAIVFKEMNVAFVGMGLESNSARILKYLNKGNTPEINQKAVDILRKYGFAVHCSFIKDVPIETKEDLKATYAFIKLNNLSYDMYSLIKFPNTPLYDGNVDWSSFEMRRSVQFRKDFEAFCRRRIAALKKRKLRLQHYENENY